MRRALDLDSKKKSNLEDIQEVLEMHKCQIQVTFEKIFVWNKPEQNVYDKMWNSIDKLKIVKLYSTSDKNVGFILYTPSVGADLIRKTPKINENTYVLVGQKINLLIASKGVSFKDILQKSAFAPRLFQAETRLGLGRHFNHGIFTEFVLSGSTFSKDKNMNVNRRDINFELVLGKKF